LTDDDLTSEPTAADTPDSADEGKPCLVLVTGLSGSGKSTVSKCFEDLGYYCVDNLPLPLLETLLSNPLESVQDNRRIAVIADVRAAGFLEKFPQLVRGVDRETIDLTLLFLEASDEILVRRFSETRRPHPLAPNGSVIEGIQRERALMADLRGVADLVLDSTGWSIHELRTHVFRQFAAAPDRESRLALSLVSFGFKHGIPYGTDLLFDARFLPNPYFVSGLREKTGLDPEVRSFLEGEEDFRELAERVRSFLLYVLPHYRRENRSYLTISIGCTGGHHRSVALCERLAEQLEEENWPVRVHHRDISRSSS